MGSYWLRFANTQLQVTPHPPSSSCDHLTTFRRDRLIPFYFCLRLWQISAEMWHYTDSGELYFGPKEYSQIMPRCFPNYFPMTDEWMICLHVKIRSFPLVFFWNSVLTFFLTNVLGFFEGRNETNGPSGRSGPSVKEFWHTYHPPTVLSGPSKGVSFLCQIKFIPTIDSYSV